MRAENAIKKKICHFKLLLNGLHFNAVKYPIKCDHEGISDVKMASFVVLASGRVFPSSLK